jgi:phosphopantothenate--cysteine ligase
VKILITGGGCEEPIDGVRCISNFSSGATASFISDYFVEQGAEVTLFLAQKALKPKSSLISISPFKSFADLQRLLIQELQKEYDGVIHCAAVSDYSVKSLETATGDILSAGERKIDSGDELVIRLKKNPKLIDSIKNWSSNAKVKLVGFKLTRGDDEQTALKRVEKLQQQSGADWVVWNDLDNIAETRHITIIFQGNTPLYHGNSKEDLALNIYRLLEGAR